MTAYAEMCPGPLVLSSFRPANGVSPNLDTSDNSRTLKAETAIGGKDPNEGPRVPFHHSEPLEVFEDLDFSSLADAPGQLVRRVKRWAYVQEKYARACEYLLDGCEVSVVSRYKADLHNQDEAGTELYPWDGGALMRIPLPDHEWKWRNENPPRDSDAGILENWAARLDKCGQVAALVKCKITGKHGIVSDCCKCPACPRYQRRRASEAHARMKEMLRQGFPAYGGQYPEERILKKRRASALRPGRKVEKVDTRHYSWKMITIPFRNCGDIEADVATALRLRPLLVKRLRDYCEAPMDGWGSIEVSPAGFVHLHFIFFLPYQTEIIKDCLEQWMVKSTCTATDCDHSEYRLEGGKCNGSYVKHVTETYDRDKSNKGSLEAFERGVLEAVKYAVAPMSTAGLDENGEYLIVGLTDEDAVRNIKCLIAMYRKHRVETYGYARKMASIVATQEESKDSTTPEEQGIVEPELVGYIFRSGARVWGRVPPGRSSQSSQRSISVSTA